MWRDNTLIHYWILSRRRRNIEYIFLSPCTCLKNSYGQYVFCPMTTTKMFWLYSYSKYFVISKNVAFDDIQHEVTCVNTNENSFVNILGNSMPSIKSKRKTIWCKYILLGNKLMIYYKQTTHVQMLLFVSS